MKATFKRHEIDHHVLKLIVGIIALFLASLTELLSANAIASISASYHEGGLARDFFVGLLFAISAFFFAYNGETTTEMVLAKVAAVAAIVVAIVPCGCGIKNEIFPFVHYSFAAIMFAVLACYCVIFFRRARQKGNRQAAWRADIYALCGFAIVLSMAVLALDFVAGGLIRSRVERLVFYGERTALIAFGISWLVASRAIPFITADYERVRVLPVKKS